MANANKTESAKKAWETIRAKKAAAAAGLPVPPSTTRAKAPEVDYSPRIAAWLGTVEVTPEVVAPAPETVETVEAPVEAAPVEATPAAEAKPEAPAKRKRTSKRTTGAPVAEISKAKAKTKAPRKQKAAA